VGNTLIGFSEGAYAAMNVGVREPRTFNRWLILAANSKYWGGPGLEALGSAKNRVRRVFLITGEHDGVIEGTHQVEAWLQKAGVPTKVVTPDNMGHEVPLEKKTEMYRGALSWLDAG
jgi:predicted esterase